VGNLPYEMTTETLAETFKGCGTIVDSIVKLDGKTGRSRGFGVVEFSDPAEAEKAIAEFNNKNLGERPLVVRYDRDGNRGAPRGGGGYGGGPPQGYGGYGGQQGWGGGQQGWGGGQQGGWGGGGGYNQGYGGGPPQGGYGGGGYGGNQGYGGHGGPPPGGYGGQGGYGGGGGRGMSDQDIRARLIDREKARIAKDYRVADDIRSQLQGAGIRVDDLNRTWTSQDGRSGPRPSAYDDPSFRRPEPGFGGGGGGADPNRHRDRSRSRSRGRRRRRDRSASKDYASAKQDDASAKSDAEE